MQCGSLLYDCSARVVTHTLCSSPDEIKSRGGGFEFSIPLVSDGSRVGTLEGQVSLHDFDKLREKVSVAWGGEERRLEENG